MADSTSNSGEITERPQVSSAMDITERTVRPQSSPAMDITERTVRPQSNPAMDVTERTVSPQNSQPLDVTERTVMPQENMSDGTLRPGREMSLENTSRAGSGMGDIITATQNDYLIKGKLYTVLENLSSSSGEAQVFLVENEGEMYVLKLYYPNARPDMNVLRTVWNMDFDLVLHLFDFGEIEIEGDVRVYEIQEYLRGGSLAEYHMDGDEEAFASIMLQASAAIEYCHALNIIHKDIKPSNFFFRDPAKTQLVLGDFGISIVAEGAEYGVRTVQARTPVYAAPEMYLDVVDSQVEITPACDFYSLGLTLLTTWLGHNPFVNNERVMLRLKSEGRIPEVEKLPAKFSTAIRGLSSARHDKRWSFKEIERWYNGEEVPVDSGSLFLRYKEFMVDAERNLVAHDVRELSVMLHDNISIGVKYLYSGRLSRWFEECGNQKLAVEMDDIVKNRFPNDEEAGLLFAIYTMDDQFPYYDLNDKPCHSISEIALSVFNNPDAYSIRLRDPADSLYAYLEAHEVIDRNRLSGYFRKEPQNKAIFMFVMEVDSSLSFLSNLPSSNIKEITASFASGKCSNDQWHSITDGRFLSWMYGHEDSMLCEAVRLLTEGKQYSETLAYTVLYSVDHQCGFDLKDARSREDVGRLLDEALQKYQTSDNILFEEQMQDFIAADGKLHHYATCQGWTDVLYQMGQILNVNSKANKDRLGAYDIRVAAYKFCAAIGHMPSYVIDDRNGDTVYLTSLNDLETNDQKAIQRAMIRGSLKSWLTLHFHEDPHFKALDGKAYEECLQAYLNMVGKYDPSDLYYKRFVSARKQAQKTYQQTIDEWNSLMSRERLAKIGFIAMCLLFACMCYFLRIGSPEFLIAHRYLCVFLPLGICSLIIGGERGYMSGNGPLLTVICGIIGGVTALVPTFAIGIASPASVSALAAAIAVAYMVICLLMGRHVNIRKRLSGLTPLIEQNSKTDLFEPLNFTFRSHASKFTASKSGVLDDARLEMDSARTDLYMYYNGWILMVIVMFVIFITYHHTFGNFALPDMDSWEARIRDIYEQIKDIR